MRSPAASRVIGYRALGRQGELGIVVGVAEGQGRPSELVIRGGVSSALTYFVPATLVRSVSSERRSILLDADLSDFVPRLHEDGTVELRAAEDRRRR